MGALLQHYTISKKPSSMVEVPSESIVDHQEGDIVPSPNHLVVGLGEVNFSSNRDVSRVTLDVVPDQNNVFGSTQHEVDDPIVAGNDQCIGFVDSKGRSNVVGPILIENGGSSVVVYDIVGPIIKGVGVVGSDNFAYSLA